MSPPVVLLVSANHQVGPGFLRNLGPEMHEVREALDVAEAKQRCKVEIVPNATREVALSSCQKHQEALAVFHFAGHGDGNCVLFETPAGKTEGADPQLLTDFVKTLKTIKLVFLNGCSTRSQADQLLGAGVPAVVATSRAVRDDVARAFAKSFYAGLGGGGTIQAAFEQAEAIAKHMATEGSERSLLRKEAADRLEQGTKAAPGSAAIGESLTRDILVTKTDDGKEWPWLLLGTDEARSWKLPSPASQPQPPPPPPGPPWRHVWFWAAAAVLPAAVGLYRYRHFFIAPDPSARRYPLTLLIDGLPKDAEGATVSAGDCAAPVVAPNRFDLEVTAACDQKPLWLRGVSGYCDQDLGISAADWGSARRVEFAAKRRTRRIRVTTPGEKPVPNAVVRAGRSSTTTDDDGWAEIPIACDAPKRIELTITHSSHHVKKDIDVGRDGPLAVTVDLPEIVAVGDAGAGGSGTRAVNSPSSDAVASFPPCDHQRCGSVTTAATTRWPGQSGTCVCTRGQAPLCFPSGRGKDHLNQVTCQCGGHCPFKP